MSWIILKKRRVWVHKTKEGIVTLWPKNALMTSRGGEKKLNFSVCTHCSFWNFVFVKYFLQIFSCLGTRVADWYIPFLTSWTPLSHEHTFPYVQSKSPHTNKTQKSSTLMQALIFPVLPCLPRALPTWQTHFCSASVTSTERYCVFAFSPTPFFSVQKVTVINVHTSSNAFWALCSYVVIRKLGWVL